MLGTGNETHAFGAAQQVKLINRNNMESNNAKKEEIAKAIAELKEKTLKAIEIVESQLPLYTEEKITYYRQHPGEFISIYEKLSDSLQNMVDLRNTLGNDFGAVLFDYADLEDLKEILVLQNKSIDLHTFIKNYLERIVF